LLLLTGLPILSLLQLFGGIDPWLLWGGFGASALAMIAGGSAAIWQSANSRRPGEAIVKSYALTLGLPFLFGHGVILLWMPLGLSPSGCIIAALALAVATTVFFVVQAVYYIRRSQNEEPPAKWTAPHFESTRRCLPNDCGEPCDAPLTAPPKRRHRIRRFPRPPVGDAPMLWKELHLGPPIVAMRPLALIAILCVIGLSAAGWILRLAVRADVTAMNIVVQLIGIGSAVVTLVIPSVYAAGSVWSERALQTLDGLLATPLTLTEILWAKWVSSGAQPAILYVFLGSLWTAGVLTGALHILAVPILVLSLAVFAAASTSLGLWIGLIARSAGQAQFFALAAAIFLLIGGPLGFFCLPGSVLLRELPGAVGLVPVAHLCIAAFPARRFIYLDGNKAGLALLSAVVHLLICGGGAWLMWRLALRQFRKLYSRGAAE
jgi:hypothetical protein